MESDPYGFSRPRGKKSNATCEGCISPLLDDHHPTYLTNLEFFIKKMIPQLVNNEASYA
jgi:hypothetical protein